MSIHALASGTQLLGQPHTLKTVRNIDKSSGVRETHSSSLTDYMAEMLKVVVSEQHLHSDGKYTDEIDTAIIEQEMNEMMVF